MLIELHTHTIHSKSVEKGVLDRGINSTEEMVRRAKKIGLDGIAITDHDTIDGLKHIRKYSRKYDIMVIPGEEVSTAKGHMLALGVNKVISPGLSVDETVDLIHKQGATAVAAHPFGTGHDGVGFECLKADAAEAFNMQSWKCRVINYKAYRLALRYNLPITAGSDAHSVDWIGYGVTETKSMTLDGALRDIRKGRTILHNQHYAPAKVEVDYMISLLRSFSDEELEVFMSTLPSLERAVFGRVLRTFRGAHAEYPYRFMAYFYRFYTSYMSLFRELISGPEY